MIHLVLSTIGSEEAAVGIAETLVAERLVACVNVVPRLTSVYRWEGKVQKDAEALMILKTAPDRLEALLERLKELHPYDVPEMVVLDVERGHPAYLDWVLAETRPGG